MHLYEDNFSFFFFIEYPYDDVPFLYGSRSNFQEILHNLHRFIGRESVYKFSGNFLFRVYWDHLVRTRQFERRRCSTRQTEKKAHRSPVKFLWETS